MITRTGHLGTATFSDCETYRYTLTRGPADAAHHVVWLMLNPSRATEDVTDLTITKCIGFTQLFSKRFWWRSARLTIVNLFAFRSTYPDEMFAHPDPVGPDNDAAIAAAVSTAELIVCAWGTQRRAAARSEAVEGLLGSYVLSCLGTTADGSPRHPSRIGYDTELEEWLGSGGHARE